LQWALLALILIAVAAAVALSVARDDGGSAADQACRTVVRAVREWRDGRLSTESVLDVVRRQGAVAQAAAGTDPVATSIVVAMDEMRVNMEAGRPWPSVVVLYELCG
jgi:hypothetical protein